MPTTTLKRSLSILAVLYFAPLSYAQQPITQTFPLPEELETARINDLEVDHQGFIWLASEEGLYRFDGVAYRRYGAGDSIGHVVCLEAGKNNRLWFGLTDGRAGFIREQEVTVQDVAFGAAVTDIVSDSAGNTWIATYGAGIFFHGQDTLFQLASRRGLHHEDIYSMAIMPDGLVIAGTDGGIYLIRRTGEETILERLTTDQGLPDNIVLQVTPGAKNTVWLGMYNRGFCRFDPREKKFDQVQENWQDGPVTALAELNDHLWIGASNGGLFRLNLPANHLSAVAGESPAGGEISALASDDEGNMWIANGSPTLIHASGFFEYLYQIGGSAIGNIHALYADNRDNLWFSAKAGVFQLRIGKENYGELVHHKRLPDFSAFPAISLYREKGGDLWIGTFGAGAIRYQPSSGNYEWVKEHDGLVNGNVLSISGFDDEIWFATLGGVSRLVNRSGSAAFTHFNDAAGVGANYIYQVFIDSKKREWFATDGRGVIMLENGQTTRIGGLDDEVILSVAEDSEGSIWFSSSQNGLYKYAGDSTINFDKRHGLKELSISGLATTGDGSLLAAHKNGLDIIDVKSHAIRHVEHTLFKDIDPDLNSVAADHHGNIWFGTKRGLIKYNHNSGAYRTQPKIVLDIKTFRTRRTGEKIFRHNENYLGFEFMALWHQDPQSVKYRYKLDGFDMEWHNSTDRFAAYPKLAPGNYTFRVQAALNPSTPALSTVSYPFRIAPPFWRKPIFIALSSVFAVFLIAAAVKMSARRAQNLERLKRERLAFQFEMLKSQVNPHFLFNSFNTLMSIIDEDRNAALEYVEKLSDFFRNTLVHRDKELISVADELGIIEKYYFLQKSRYHDRFAVAVNLPEQNKNDLIAPLTLQLLLENAIKHNVISSEHKLIVDIYEDNDYIVVKNNLRKKKKIEASAGVGLQNIKNRYGILTNRPVEVIETQNEFTVKIPLIRSVK